MVYTSPYVVVVFVVVVVVRHCCIPISREKPELHTYLPPKSITLAWGSTDSPFGTVCSVSCALLLVVARVEMCTYSLEQRGGVAVDGRPTFGAPSRRCLRVCSPTFREDVAMGTQVPVTPASLRIPGPK